MEVLGLPSLAARISGRMHEYELSILRKLSSTAFCCNAVASVSMRGALQAYAARAAWTPA